MAIIHQFRQIITSASFLLFFIGTIFHAHAEQLISGIDTDL